MASDVYIVSFTVQNPKILNVISTEDTAAKTHSWESGILQFNNDVIFALQKTQSISQLARLLNYHDPLMDLKFQL